jgi:hypothetical protein
MDGSNDLGVYEATNVAMLEVLDNSSRGCEGKKE